MKNRLSLLASLGASLWLCTPSVAWAQLPWCDGAPADTTLTIDQGVQALQALDGARATQPQVTGQDRLRRLFGFACQEGATEANAGALTELRDRWAKNWNLTPEEVGQLRSYLEFQPEVRPVDPTRVSLRSLSPSARAQSVVRHVYDLEGDSNRPVEMMWWLDTFQLHPPETLRTAYLETCQQKLTRTLHHFVDVPSIVELGICLVDVKQSNPTRLNEEVAALPVVERIDWKVRRAEVLAGFRVLEERVRAFIGDDAVAQSLLDSIPDKAVRTWTSTYQAHRAHIDLALEIEDSLRSTSRKAFEGCLAKSQPLFEKQVRKHASKVGQDPYAVLTDPVGYIVAGTHAACLNKSETSVAGARFLAGLMSRRLMWRGPRFAAYNAVAQVLPTLKFDNTELKVHQPMGARAKSPESLTGIGTQDEDGDFAGVVEKVVAQGEMVKVSFTKTKARIPTCVQYKVTNRITRIKPDGVLEYERFCIKDKLVTVVRVPEPRLFSKSWSPALKAGRLISGFRAEQDGSAFPITVYANATAKKPVMVLGAPLK